MLKKIKSSGTQRSDSPPDCPVDCWRRRGRWSQGRRWLTSSGSPRHSSHDWWHLAFCITWLLCWSEQSSLTLVQQGWISLPRALTRPVSHFTRAACLLLRPWLMRGGWRRVGDREWQWGIRCSKLGIIQHISLMKSKVNLCASCWKKVYKLHSPAQQWRTLWGEWKTSRGLWINTVVDIQPKSLAVARWLMEEEIMEIRTVGGQSSKWEKGRYTPGTGSNPWKHSNAAGS